VQSIELGIATNAAAVAAFAAPACAHVAIADLEVYARAVSLRNARGEVRPQVGWTVTQTPSQQGIGMSTDESTGYSSVFSGLDYALSSKPRPGSNAISSTG